MEARSDNDGQIRVRSIIPTPGSSQREMLPVTRREQSGADET